MKIYSKFRDYYDGVGYYDANDRIWERKSKYLKLNDHTIKGNDTSNGLSPQINDFLLDVFNKVPIPRISYPSTRNSMIRPSYHDHKDFTIVIGFCGKLYIGVVHAESKAYRTEIVNTFNNYSEYMRSKFSIHSNIDIVKHSFNRMDFSQEGFAEWHGQYQNHKILNSIFVELKTPIFIVYPLHCPLVWYSSDLYNNSMVISPCMSDWKLYNIFHSFMAYQEIDMYLGNALAMCNYKELERSDDLIRDSKGFDNWSFRQKGPKKRKRKLCK